MMMMMMITMTKCRRLYWTTNSQLDFGHNITVTADRQQCASQRVAAKEREGEHNAIHQTWVNHIVTASESCNAGWTQKNLE